MPNGLADKIAMNTEVETEAGYTLAADTDSMKELFVLSIERAALLTHEEVTAALQSDTSKGLTYEEVERRLERFGANELGKKATVSPWTLMSAQFNSTVVYLLLLAAAVSAFGGENLQAFGILIAVLINSLVGFVTEYKAQISLAALEKLAGPISRVRRGGKDLEVSVSEIVPGDIVILEEGSRVPADIRLVSSSALSLDESMISGESIPVYKEAQGDVQNQAATVALQGTLILKGRAKGIVVSTGSNTKLGQLGLSLSDIQSKATPLQDDLETLGKHLSIITVVVCLLIFVIGLLKGEALFSMLQASVALAVAAIPEGLPVVATLALASGTSRMVKLGALIRKLSAVETLGCTEIICTDKTGTLTQNQMTVTDIVIDANHLKVSGLGYKPEGVITAESESYDVGNCPLLSLLLKAGVLCNDAKLESHDDSQWHIHGDPTEGALLTAALKVGIEQRNNREKSPRHDEYVFDLASKRMTTIHKVDDGSYSAFTKGAPETVLSLCSSYLSEDGSLALEEEKRQWYEQKNIELASKGLRVLGFATRSFKSYDAQNRKDIECNMTFLGLIGMSDRPKEGVLEAVKECQRAGMKVIMITGDQPATALSVAKDLGILTKDQGIEDVIVGNDLKEMSPEQIKEALSTCAVLARVKPEEKLSIVQALQSTGKVVAMTGDGINDAPALRQSDIGVAMGQSGTSMAREASDIVITDDNFPTIVHAVEQGRVIYTNISCAVAYLLTASLASVFAVAVSVVAGIGLPLSPLQLLWLNLIMHIFPGLGLVLQKARPGIMTEPPRGRKQTLIGKKDYIQIFARGLIVAFVTTLCANNLRGESTAILQTGVLCTISIALLLQSWSWLAMKRRSDDISYFGSVAMIVNTILGGLLLYAAVFFAPLQNILGTCLLSSDHWTMIGLFAAFSYFLTYLLPSD